MGKPLENGDVMGINPDWFLWLVVWKNQVNQHREDWIMMGYICRYNDIDISLTNTGWSFGTFFHSVGNGKSSQLTNSIIWVGLNHQPVV